MPYPKDTRSEKERAGWARRYAQDPEPWRAKSRKSMAAWRKKHPELALARVRANGKRYYAKLRREAMDAYGACCWCCGETVSEFLCLDHVNGGRYGQRPGDGGAHRREVGHGQAFYRALKKAGYPQDGRLRVLCHNCNMAIGFYGRCPHGGDK